MNPDIKSHWNDDRKKFYKFKNKKRWKKKKIKFTDGWLKRPKFKEKISRISNIGQLIS
jgi:hypothetical protein